MDTDDQHYRALDRVDALSPRELSDIYLDNKPVIIGNASEDERPLFDLKVGRFRDLTGSAYVPAKRGDVRKSIETPTNVEAFLTARTEFPDEAAKDYDEKQLYIHDVSILDFSYELQQAARQFRTKYLPRWYRKSGWRLLRLFVSRKGDITPLHFDTLETHNLFFQIHGKKEFLLIPSEYRHLYHLVDWRWSSVDLMATDQEFDPALVGVPKYRAILNEGDMLYIPPRWLHQVRSLETSISANIDWHTVRSAARALSGVWRGAPTRNFSINLRYFLGLVLRIPLTRVLHRGIISRGIQQPG